MTPWALTESATCHVFVAYESIFPETAPAYTG